jgi:hypothetical protein
MHHLRLHGEAGLRLRRTCQENGKPGDTGHETFGEAVQFPSPEGFPAHELRGRSDFDPIVTGIWGGDVAA